MGWQRSAFSFRFVYLSRHSRLTIGCPVAASLAITERKRPGSLSFVFAECSTPTSCAYLLSMRAPTVPSHRGYAALTAYGLKQRGGTRRRYPLCSPTWGALPLSPLGGERESFRSTGKHSMKRTSVAENEEHFERPTNHRLIIDWQRNHVYVLNCNATLRSLERRAKARKNVRSTEPCAHGGFKPDAPATSDEGYGVNAVAPY